MVASPASVYVLFIHVPEELTSNSSSVKEVIVVSVKLVTPVLCGLLLLFL